MPHEPTIDEVAAFVRRFAGISPSRPIDAETKIDADLGITGMEGHDLLQAAEENFGVILATKDNGVRSAFQLGRNEYLFGSEGLDLLGITALTRWLKGEPQPVVHDLTINELQQAISRAATLQEERAA